MPTPSFGGIPSINLQNANLEQLRAYVIQLQGSMVKMQRDLTYLLSNLDYENIFEVGGWRVTPTELKSKDGDVGFSTEDTAADDIRIWAGDAKDGDPNYVVRKSGKTVIKSASGYPRLEFNSDLNLLSAFFSSTNFLKLLPVISGNPGFLLDNGLVQVQIGNSSTDFVINSTVGFGDIQLSSGVDLELFAQNLVRFQQWSKLYNNSTNRTLQQDLDSKANAFSGLSASISVVTGFDGGGNPIYALLSFSNGVLTNVTT